MSSRRIIGLTIRNIIEEKKTITVVPFTFENYSSCLCPGCMVQSGSACVGEKRAKLGDVTTGSWSSLVILGRSSYQPSTAPVGRATVRTLIRSVCVSVVGVLLSSSMGSARGILRAISAGMVVSYSAKINCTNFLVISYSYKNIYNRHIRNNSYFFPVYVKYPLKTSYNLVRICQRSRPRIRCLRG